MMKANSLCIIMVALVWGCATFKKELIKSGGRNEVIQNAILDFSRTTRLYEGDTVFSIRTGEDKEILIVRIGKNTTKLLLTAATRAGGKNNVLPTRFKEKDGKLFIWWDDNYPLTEEAIAVFHKYDLFQDDEGGVITVPDFAIDDARKSAHYYFCKSDLSKYKKVVTNKGIGYYDLPKLKCNP